MLPSQTIQRVFLTVALLILIFNIVSISLLTHQKLDQYAAMTIPLNITECLWAIYLSVVYGVNIYFKQGILFKLHQWQQSFLCQTIAYISLLYILLDPTLVSLLALSRHRTTASPFTSRFRELKMCVRLVVTLVTCMVIFACVIEVLFVVQYERLPTVYILPLEY